VSWSYVRTIRMHHDLVHTASCAEGGQAGLYNYLLKEVSRGSSVSIVTRLRDVRPRFDSRQELGLFLLATASDRFWDPSSLQSNGYRG
jgi:hypothetical protein